MKKLITLLLVIITAHCFSQEEKQDLGPYLKWFDVSKNRGKNVITWTTKNENGVSWFLLEASEDGKDYTGITLYDSGSLNKKAYEFMDGKHPNARYYRIIVKDKEDNILDIRNYHINDAPKKVRMPEERFVKIPCNTRDFLLSP